MKDYISVAVEMYLFNLNGSYTVVHLVKIIDYVPAMCKALFLFSPCGVLGKSKERKAPCNDFMAVTYAKRNLAVIEY